MLDRVGGVAGAIVGGGLGYLYCSGDDAIPDADADAKPREDCPPKDDEPCYKQYIKDTGWCGANILDDYLYEQCMSTAWRNYIRCKNGLPPKPWIPAK